jgi:O-methyltransferase
MNSDLGAPMALTKHDRVKPNSAAACISSAVRTSPEPRTAEEMYLDLLKRSLTRTVFAKEYERHTLKPSPLLRRCIHAVVKRVLAPLNMELVRLVRSRPQDYVESGHEATNRVEDAETMLGTLQLDQMQFCINDVCDRGIPGDLLEAGVWRGGMTVFMRGVLKARRDNLKRVWVVDSFAGLPDPDAKFDSFGWKAGDMAVSLDEVKCNFVRYGLLDDQVVFLKGVFCDSLPKAPISALSVLRVDADLYESTLDVLNNLYPKLSVGGYAIFDDYQNLKDCRKAVDEYRHVQRISDPIVNIDSRAVFWRKAAAPSS